MTKEAYKSMIIKAVKTKDENTLNLISKMLFESEQTKQKNWRSLSSAFRTRDFLAE